MHVKVAYKHLPTTGDKELTLAEFVEGCLADKELFQILTNESKK